MSALFRCACCAGITLVFLGCGASVRPATPQPMDGGRPIDTGVVSEDVTAVDVSIDATRDVAVDVSIDATRDAVADVASDVPPPRACITGGTAARCVVVEPARAVVARASVPTGAIDVVLLVDDTLSMGPVIDRLTTTLRTTIVPRLQTSITDLRIGVAAFGDFPVDPYGILGHDLPFRRYEPVTADITAVQRAISAIMVHFGNDLPESGVEALYQLATGAGIPPFLAPSLPCSSGGIGAMCFRPEAAHLVLMMTDAPSHNGPVSGAFYDNAAFPEARPHTWPETLEALTRHRIRVLGVETVTPAGGANAADLRAMALATGGVSAPGEPLVYTRASGEVDVGIVDAIQRFRGETYTRVEARSLGCPPGAPATVVRAVRAVRAIPMGPMTRLDGAAVVGPPRGSTVEFEIELDPTFAARGPVQKRALIRVEIRGDGDAIVGVDDIDLVVPALGSASGC